MTGDWLVQTFFDAGSMGAYAVQGATAVTVVLLLLLAAFSEGPRVLAWAREQSSQAALVAGAMALGLVVRLSLPTGPMDIYFRLEPAEAPVELAKSVYGLAFPTVVRMLWALTGPSDPAIFGMNTALGVLTIGAVHALSLRLSPSRTAAGVASLTVALSPLLAHFSRTDIQTVLEVLLTAWGLTALLRKPHLPSALTAGLALGLAATLRPEALVIPLIAVTALWATRRRPTATDAAWASGLGVLLPSGLATLGLALTGVQTGALASVSAFDHGILHPLFLDPGWTPIWVTSGLFLLPFATEPSRRVRGWVLAWALLLTWLVWGFSPVQVHYAGMRHQIRAVPFIALSAGFGLAPALTAIRGRRPLQAVLAAVALGTTILAFQQVRLPPTALLEYRFVRDHIEDVPAGCWVLSHLNPQGRDAGLIPPQRLSQQAGLGHQWLDLDHGSVPREGCAVYYRGSNCWARTNREALPPLDQWGPRPDCLDTESVLGVEPLATVRLPTRKFGTDHYTEGSTVEVGFYQIPGRTELPPPPASAARSLRPQNPTPPSEPTRPPPAGPPPALPADWPADAVKEALLADNACPADLLSCQGGLCVIGTRSPTCAKDHCGEAAEDSIDYETARVSWHDDEGLGAVACALLPAEDPDAAFLRWSNAKAAELLFEMLHGEPQD